VLKKRVRKAVIWQTMGRVGSLAIGRPRNIVPPHSLEGAKNNVSRDCLGNLVNVCKNFCLVASCMVV